MSDDNNFRKQFLALLSGNTISQIIPFLLIPFITHFYSKEEIGISANWFSIVGLIGIISTGRLEVAIPLPKKNLEAKLLFSSGLFITFCVTILSLLLVVFSEQIADFYHDPELKNHVWLMPFGVLSYGLLGLTTNWALRNRRYKRVTTGKIIQSLINNLGAVFLGYLAFGTSGLLIAWALSQFINAFILMDKNEFGKELWFSKLNFKTIKNILIKYKEFPLINSIHAFTDVFATQFLLFYFITIYYSKEELALFFLMTRYVKAPIVLVSGSVSQLYFVEASKAVVNKTSGLPIALKTIKTSFLFAIPFTIVLLVFGPSIFELYLGAEWRDAGVYAQFMAPMFFVFFFVSPLSSTPLMFNKQKTSFVFSLLGYLFTIGSIVIGNLFNWEFKCTLGLYSLFFSMYYLALIVWYLKLLKDAKAQIV